MAEVVNCHIRFLLVPIASHGKGDAVPFPKFAVRIRIVSGDATKLLPYQKKMESGRALGFAPRL
jgi:hypothetical protein